MVGQWLLRLEVRNLESLPLPALFSMGMRDMSGKGRTEPVKKQLDVDNAQAYCLTRTYQRLDNDKDSNCGKAGGKWIERIERKLCPG